jgi:hypothetical protein
MQVRLTPWAEKRIIRDYGRVNKTTLRQSLKDLPGTEFHTIANPILGVPGGKVVSVAEASGFDQIEVRFNSDRDLAIIVSHPSGQVVIR